jgi:putative ABC transport system permease protein
MLGMLLRKMFRDIGKSVAQSIALTAVVAIGVASFISLVGAYRDLGTSYTHTYEVLSFADVDVRLLSAPQEAIDRVEAVAGVKAATGRLIIDTGMMAPGAASGARPIRARLIGVAANSHPAVDDVSIERGEYFDAGADRQALLEAHFAKAYSVDPGATVTPIVNGTPTSFRVTGVAASPEYLVVSASRQDIIPDPRNFAVLFVPLTTVQDLFKMGNVVNDVAIRLDAGADKQVVVAHIRSLLGSFGIEEVTWQADQASNAALKLDLDGYQQIGFFMPLLILIAAAAALFVMLGRQIRAQEPQIGIMMALGYGRGSVLFHYLSFSFVIALCGSVLGVIAGIPLGRLITSSYAGELGIPLVQSRVYADLIFIAAGLSIFVSLVAGFFPARRASVLLPAKAMRQDPAMALSRGGRTLVERALPLSVWGRLPFRNVFRVRSRAFSTLIGVIFAFILVLASLAMMDSMQRIVYDTFHKTERWDISVAFNEPQPIGHLQAVSEMAGVRSVEPILQLPVAVSAQSRGKNSEELLLTAYDPSLGMHHLDVVSGPPASVPLAAGDIVLTETIADKLGVAAGDIVRVSTPFGETTFTVRSLVNEMMGSVAYMSFDAARQWMPSGMEVYNGLYLTAAGGAPTQEDLVSRLYGLPGVSNVQLKTSVETAWNSLMGLYYALMGMILLFAFAMAFALLFNAMTVNVLEQQREIATMRSVGASSWRVAFVVLSETFLLWLVALIPGLLLGEVTAREMGNALNSDLFSLSISASPSSCLLSAGGILLVMLFSCLPAIRRVNRLNLATATKMLS